MLAVVANEAGRDFDAATAAVATMGFPSVEEQLSDNWLGGGIAKFMKGVAGVFVEAGGYRQRSKALMAPSLQPRCKLSPT